MKCRFCKSQPLQSFLDLGGTPVSNAFLTEQDLSRAEKVLPLQVHVCPKCWLAQIDECEKPSEIFNENYAYFSSYSDSWLKHCSEYVDQVSARFNLRSGAYVTEIASNDGYLLQYFKAKGIHVEGIEPSANVAKVAMSKGIPTTVQFFGKEMSEGWVASHKKVDLLIANNVLAHVPDLNDFVAGMKVVLADEGVCTIEFPHLLALIQENQFDTVYHEHFSYFSLLAATKIFAAHGLRIFDVDQIKTHGGSLRIYVCHENSITHKQQDSVEKLIQTEVEYGLRGLDVYAKFQNQINKIKWDLLEFLIKAKRDGKKIVAYGAPAKGNTLLNFCGVKSDFIDYTVDRNEFKQGKFLPGTRIPVKKVEEIQKTRPDYLLILPWNIRDEIMMQMEGIRQWGGKFVVPIPHLKVL